MTYINVSSGGVLGYLPVSVANSCADVQNFAKEYFNEGPFMKSKHCSWLKVCLKSAYDLSFNELFTSEYHVW